MASVQPTRTILIFKAHAIKPSKLNNWKLNIHIRMLFSLGARDRLSISLYISICLYIYVSICDSILSLFMFFGNIIVWAICCFFSSAVLLVVSYYSVKLAFVGFCLGRYFSLRHAHGNAGIRQINLIVV